MNSSDLIRYSGLAAILDVAVLLISDLLSLTVFSGDMVDVVTTGPYLADGSSSVLAGVLLLLGLVGLYARQSEEIGAPGLAAFFAGTAMILGTWWTRTSPGLSGAWAWPAYRPP